jgi:multicomponent Na+:H+ antiporter subunit B
MNQVVIRTVTRVLVPFIQLFGLYVIVHGPVSPGGGFQGGVIVGSSMILVALAYGLNEAEKMADHNKRIIMDCVGSLIYGGIGLLGIAAGGMFLQYGIIPLPLPPARINNIMIFLIGSAIGIHIMALVLSLFLHTAKEAEIDD